MTEGAIASCQHATAHVEEAARDPGAATGFESASALLDDAGVDAGFCSAEVAADDPQLMLRFR